MLKMILLIIATALVAFSLSVWRAPAERTVGSGPQTQPTISPAQLHLKINPADLASTRVDHYN